MQRLFKSFVLGFFLSLAAASCQQAAPLPDDASNPARPHELEEDGVPITGIRPDFFKLARFIQGEPVDTSGLWLRSVRECYQVSQRRFIAIAEEMNGSEFQNRRWFFHYEGVHFPSNSAVLTRDTQPQPLFSQLSSQPLYTETATHSQNIGIASVSIPHNPGAEVHQQVTETWRAGDYRWELTPGGSVGGIAVGTSWLFLSDPALATRAGWLGSSQYFNECRLDDLSL
jgi:hypothetical protein